MFMIVTIHDRAAEYANAEVLIGLTTLAYRYVMSASPREHSYKHKHSWPPCSAWFASLFTLTHTTQV